jgi:hypothetical protein
MPIFLWNLRTLLSSLLRLSVESSSLTFIAAIILHSEEVDHPIFKVNKRLNQYLLVLILELTLLNQLHDDGSQVFVIS